MFTSLWAKFNSTSQLSQRVQFHGPLETRTKHGLALPATLLQKPSNIGTSISEMALDQTRKPSEEKFFF